MTIQDAIKLQTLQLKKYRATLNEQAFKALLDYCTAENTKVLDDLDGDAYDIPYSGNLDNFLTDWADSQEKIIRLVPLADDLKTILARLPDIKISLNGGEIVGMVFEGKFVTLVVEFTKVQMEGCDYDFGSDKPNWVK